MGFFPNKQFAFSSEEDWAKEMRKDLNESLTKSMFTIKERTGTRIVQKSAYIEHLISQEKSKRRKHAVSLAEDAGDNGIPVSEVQSEDEERPGVDSNARENEASP